MANLIVYSDLLNSKNLTEEIEKLTDKLGKDANKRYSKYASTAKNTLIIAKEKNRNRKSSLKIGYTIIGRLSMTPFWLILLSIIT